MSRGVCNFMCLLDDFLVQPPLEKRPQVEASQPQDIEATTYEQPTHRNHPHSEMLSQRRDTKEDGMETSLMVSLLG